MDEKTRARDRSSIQHCRIELPKLIDDMNLSVYAYRLYGHIKRIAEEKDGSCWESARTLATACNMSAGQVSKAKDELEKHGLITRHIKAVRGGIGDDITIVDIWPQTFKRYAPGSDHAVITSKKKAITARSLRHRSDHTAITSEESDHTAITSEESDHTAITSEESDHTAIAETIKRSYSDPNSKSTIVGVGVGGVGESLTRELIERGLNPTSAELIAQSGCDDTTILQSLDNMLADGRVARKDRDKVLGNFMRRWKAAPPLDGTPYARQSETATSTAPPPVLAPRLSQEEMRVLNERHGPLKIGTRHDHS